MLRSACILKWLLLRLDAYYLMFKKVSTYLKQKPDKVRLTLVRLCFYLKLERSLVGVADTTVINMRKKLLSRLCRNWGWTSVFREELKSREHWKVNFVDVNKMISFLPA